jgi:hypothetical protein
MSDGEFENRIRAIFKEVSRSIEDAAENIDLDEIADRIGMSSERFREFAETAGEWLSHQFFEGQAHPFEPGTNRAEAHENEEQQHEASVHDEDEHEPAKPPTPRTGPHPRDLPTEEQGLALSALDSERWKVRPGTDELLSGGEGPDPALARGLVGELRARDWIASSGEVTLVGRDALRRWLASDDES